DSVFIYIQMQLCNYSLADWLKDNQADSSRNFARMKRWFKQIVSAVEYIHGKDLIHRDLKPSNILFTDNDRMKICDLGIVTDKTNDEHPESKFTRTSAGTMLHMSPEQGKWTPMYMAPEQMRWSGYSSKVDVFALGLILIELSVVLTMEEAAEVIPG
ncbi:hypothetical protein PENTCL1PPCAC_30521, partial [Pristionchus entomophagus]